MFWGRERTAELQEILYGPHDACRTSINRLGNLITLCHGAHSHWNKGYFALKHISGGRYEMLLELEWLPDHPELSREGVRLDQPVGNRSALFLDDHTLGNPRTRRLIDSGYRFTMTTDNTEASLLPDERLINLQWHKLTMVLDARPADVWSGGASRLELLQDPSDSFSDFFGTIFSCVARYSSQYDRNFELSPGLSA